MAVPDLTHLQFLVLQIIRKGAKAGRDIRAELKKQGQRKSLAAFYQMMARMEDAKLVEGSYRRAIVADQEVKERWYKATASGLAAMRLVIEFYEEYGK